ncbi:MAG: glycosyltransferase [Verrucomicrobiota bacterium]|nr:glycosyltransferase [Verrucomicrobiota bacterium]
MPAAESSRNEPDRVELSIILVVGRRRQRGARALASVLQQNVIDRMEVVLMDLGPAGAAPLPGSEHPRVRTFRAGGELLFAGARARAVRLARAPVVAFIEEHCQALTGWAEVIMEAHRGPWGGVGCAFVNGNPESGLSNAAFRTTYGIYLPPRSPRGDTTWISGHNSAYKRDLLLNYGDELETLLKADVVLHWKIMQDGHRLFFDGDAKLAHDNETSLRSAGSGIFFWNWCFSNVRARIFKWSVSRKALHVALTPFIPWVRLMRSLAWARRLGWSAFIQCLGDVPFLLAVNHFAAVGQMCGLLAGLEGAERRFSNMELNDARGARAEAAS